MASVLQQLRLFNRKAKTMHCRSHPRSKGVGFGRKTVEKFYICPIFRFGRGRSLCPIVTRNNRLYDNDVTEHGLCLISRNSKNQVADSALAGGSERRLVLSHDLPTDSAYREGSICL